MHVAAGLILVLGMLSSSALGDLYVWTDGGGSNASLWNAKQNWAVDNKQANNPPANGSDVQLTGAGSSGPTIQNIANLSLKTLLFDSTCGTFTVAGNAFTLTDSGTALTVDAGAGALGISCHIALGNSQSWFIGAGRTFTVSGNVTGNAKSLTKTGDGTLVLTGTNSYSGGTTISAGAIKGNATSLQGNITDNAVLEFAQASDATYSGNISGTGSFVKSGAGTLTLAGTNSYGGGTTISAGALKGDATSLQGNITINGTLIFDQGTNATYSGALSGNGTFTKTGAGKLKLTGDSGFTGTTIVSQGKLQVTGSLASSVITIESGGMVIGSGTLDSMVVRNGGVISPGSSPGTTDTGSQTWESGGIYLWEVSKVTAGGGSQESLKGQNPGADFYNITGTLNITATAGGKFVIDIAGLLEDTEDTQGAVTNWNPTGTYSWVIVTASGGISGFDADAFDLQTGKFTSNNSIASGYGFSIGQDGNSVVLTYAPEPATLALLGAGGALLLFQRRRRPA